jgi:CHAT domain-containing protein
VSDGLGGDDQDALALAGEDILSAHALFSNAAPLPMPARVLLSACSSAGATGAGGGEWLGLTAAVLWRGARQVIATNWPIWDTPFTTSFDHKLALRLQHDADPAVTLRELQLEALSDWRDSEHDLSDHEENGLPYSARDIPFPLIWAAYTCVGIYR